MFPFFLPSRLSVVLHISEIHSEANFFGLLENSTRMRSTQSYDEKQIKETVKNKVVGDTFRTIWINMTMTTDQS